MENIIQSKHIELLPNPDQTVEFGEHLSISSNSRIIFSGRFGIGKTTFLKDFFEKDENKNIYNCIHLYPVNYSISSNEDILELLKYDVINELINNYQINTEEFDFSDSETFNGFIASHFEEIVSPILKMIPKIGKTASEFYKHISEIALKFEEFKKDILSGENNALKTFATKMDGKYLYYKDDFYTDFISRKLSEIKSDSKQNVLIIDDLDRIDPEHIFRLFNIFGAYLHDNNTGSNKWGFDKIILTCDIDNIEAIYHHKYGKKADFNGFIDKFYSHKIFQINNLSLIESWIRRKLPYPRIDHRDDYVAFIIEILNTMLNYEVINFRNIKSLNEEIIKNEFQRVDSATIKNTRYSETMFIWVAPVLSAVVGNVEQLITKIKECIEVVGNKADKTFSKKRNTGGFIAFFLLPITEFQSHLLNDGKTYIYQLPGEVKHFRYTVERLNMELLVCKILSPQVVQHPEVSPTESHFNNMIWPLLLNAVISLKDEGYLT